ncbi:hypothetical protein PYCC9005_002032 [Savitreella phatthalungensis]
MAAGHHPRIAQANRIPDDDDDETHNHTRSPSTTTTPAHEPYPPYKTTSDGFPVNNKLKRSKYATSVDERGYLSVYEFMLNEQHIMWDYHTGFVHLTGIWKALGNSKTDIVRLVDAHPELEGVIQRIRGGFLKIQGTWVPFDLCKTLAQRTCYPIRHALISVFGPEFPDQCLKPDAIGYGTLTLNDAAALAATAHKRKRSQTTTVTPTSTTIATERDLPRRSSGASGLDALPRSIELAGFASPSENDVLDLLQASRSLQRLSTGMSCVRGSMSSASFGSTDGHNASPIANEDEGGEIEIAGTLYRWDGQADLRVLSRASTSTTTTNTSRAYTPSLTLTDDFSAASTVSSSAPPPQTHATGLSQWFARRRTRGHTTSTASAIIDDDDQDVIDEEPCASSRTLGGTSMAGGVRSASGVFGGGGVGGGCGLGGGGGMMMMPFASAHLGVQLHVTAAKQSSRTTTTSHKPARITNLPPRPPPHFGFQPPPHPHHQNNHSDTRMHDA